MASTVVRGGSVYPVGRVAFAGRLVGFGRTLDHAVGVPVPGRAGHRGVAAAVRWGRRARRPGLGQGGRLVGPLPRRPGRSPGELTGVSRADSRPLGRRLTWLLGLLGLLGALLLGCSAGTATSTAQSLAGSSAASAAPAGCPAPSASAPGAKESHLPVRSLCA